MSMTDQYGLDEGGLQFSRCEHGFYNEDFGFFHAEAINGRAWPDRSISAHLVRTDYITSPPLLIFYDSGGILQM
jgi:hypothetical protein